MSGWGLRFFDHDNDGNADLFIADGHPDDQIEVHSGSVTYREPLLLFHNDGPGPQKRQRIRRADLSRPLGSAGLGPG